MTGVEKLPPAIRWVGDENGHLELLDQTLLPHQRKILLCSQVQAVADAIVRLAVRGAPAIGVAAAYGLFLGVRQRQPGSASGVLQAARTVATELAATRPTAVNLRWALDRCEAALAAMPTLNALLAEARAIHADDIACCRRLGDHGARFVQDGMTVLTHCNAGRLATSGDGTALALLFRAWQQGRRFKVLADETRPLLQGARLTALELAAEGIPVEVLPDSAAAGLIARGEVQLVVVGADRIAQNGDVANKVGTYGLALAAHAHGVPFVVVAPHSTFDLSIASGAQIPIEQRNASEVLQVAGTGTTAAGIGARNPAFDVTPAALVTALVTDVGVLSPVDTESIKDLLDAGR